MRDFNVDWSSSADIAGVREADAELRRAICELQRILDHHDPAETGLDSEQLYREWLWSLSVIRDALCAVDRIAELLAAAGAGSKEASGRAERRG